MCLFQKIKGFAVRGRGARWWVMETPGMPWPKWQRSTLLEVDSNARSVPAHAAWPRVEDVWPGEEQPVEQRKAPSELVGCSWR